MWNRHFIVAIFVLCGMAAGSAYAAMKEGGIGGTGTPAMSDGIGGTGTPAMNGGIGGTGLRPDVEPPAPTLAGKVLFVVGKVEAQNQGHSRTLSKGDPVRVGDALKSGREASLQLRMEDGGTIVLRPESQLVIESFAYNGIQDGTEHIALELLGGGFRAVTGNIGKLHKENYSISTPNAKVGIRGTDHETVFIARPPLGQTAIVEPGTYDHVISGATLLQSANGKLLIKPNQTGFAALGGASPILLEKSLPIFGRPDGDSEMHGDQHGDINDSGKEQKGSTGSGDMSGSEQGGKNSSGDISGSEQNKLTQTEEVANGSVDLNTLEADSAPAPSKSGVAGAHMAGGSPVVGSAQVGKAGNKLSTESGFPTSYSNDATGFNYLAKDAPPILSGSARVDGANVSWGIYAGGVSFDTSGKAGAVNFHAFAFTNGGVTPGSAISGSTATFSSAPVGSASVTESGNTANGGVTLNAGINLVTGTLTNYNLAVTDANARNWTGTLGSPVSLTTFANGTALTVTCTCPGQASGGAAGMLIGQGGKGLISSYALGTTNGQAVTGTVVMSRP